MLLGSVLLPLVALIVTSRSRTLLIIADGSCQDFRTCRVVARAKLTTIKMTRNNKKQTFKTKQKKQNLKRVVALSSSIPRLSSAIFSFMSFST